jgi:hypothetical protein
VALRGKVVDLVGLHLLDDAQQAQRVGEIAVVQRDARLRIVELVIKVIDALGIERRCAALDAVDLLALREQEFGEIGAVLPGDARNECAFPFHRSLAAVPNRKGVEW